MTGNVLNTYFMEDQQMKDFDFGYFGTGDEGYAQYKTAFDRIFEADHPEEDFSAADDLAEDDMEEW